MDERNSLARSDQKGSLSLSLALFLSPLLSTRQRISSSRVPTSFPGSLYLSFFISLSLSLIQHGSDVRFVAKMFQRVTYSLQLQESFVLRRILFFLLGLRIDSQNWSKEEFFFIYARNISESVSILFFCYFFRTRPQQGRVSILCLLPRRKWDNHAKIDGGWSKGGERQFWEHNGMKLCLREVVNERTLIPILNLTSKR